MAYVVTKLADSSHSTKTIGDKMKFDGTGVVYQLILAGLFTFVVALIFNMFN